MARFSISLPDHLDTWLTGQAELCRRSKNKQIEYLLTQAMAANASRVSSIITGNTQFCYGPTHYFASNVPMDGDPCNCGNVRW